MQAYVNLRLYRQAFGFNPHADGWWNMSSNRDLALETLEMFSDKQQIDWDVLDVNPNFTEKWLLAFPEKPWAWDKFHKHPKFDFDWVYVFLNKPWNWTKLSELATIPLLRQYPIFQWDWRAVTCSSEITTTEMVKNSDFPWEVSNIRFTEIEDDDIEFLHMFQEDLEWNDISESAPLHIVRQNMDLPWFHYLVDLEKFPITQDDLEFLYESSDDYTWNWARLSYIVPFELIAKNPHMPWEPELLSSNPTITYDDVQKYPNLPWDLTMTPCEPIDRIIRRWVAANLIKRKFKTAISNPEYKMCRDRLDNEFRNMAS
jgi:hypothetical protein